MSNPTIGRVVIIHSNKSNLFNGTVFDTSQPFAALVTGVHKDGNIAVTVFPPGKDALPIYSIPSAEKKEDGVAYWEWPNITGKERRSEITLNLPILDKEQEGYIASQKTVIDRPPSDDEQPESPAVKTPAKKKPTAKEKTKKE